MQPVKTPKHIFMSWPQCTETLSSSLTPWPQNFNALNFLMHQNAQFIVNAIYDHRTNNAIYDHRTSQARAWPCSASPLQLSDSPSTRPRLSCLRSFTGCVCSAQTSCLHRSTECLCNICGRLCSCSELYAFIVIALMDASIVWRYFKGWIL
jgi:hypothetical protein